MSCVPENQNVVSKAKVVGRSIAGSLGAEAFAELELAYATRLLPQFSDDPLIRTNQNILLYWQYGFYKSTILKVFSTTIPQDLKVVEISSMTPEKIFGSIDEKKRHIIEPAFTNDVHFVVVSELTSLLGQQDFMRNFVNLMNAVLENEKVSRQTLKLGQSNVNEVELSELSQKGVTYDARTGELSYKPNVCVFAASRPLDNRYYTYLCRSGHFNRYHVVQHSISDQEASDHLHKDFKLDQEALDRLKATNSSLAKVKVQSICRPCESILKPVYDTLEELVRDEIAEKPNSSLADVINPRVKGDIIREMAAHAFIRTASQNGYKDIEELQYTQEDVDFILQRPAHFVEFALNPIVADDFSKIPKVKKRDKLKSAIVAYLNDGVEHNISEILKAVNGITACQASVYNAITELLEEGKVTQTRHGYYKIGVLRS